MSFIALIGPLTGLPGLPLVCPDGFECLLRDSAVLGGQLFGTALKAQAEATHPGEKLNDSDFFCLTHFRITADPVII